MDKEKTWKPGDRARITMNLEILKCDLTWAPEMDKHKGEIVTLDYQSCGNPNWWKVKENFWTWAECWLKPVIKKTKRTKVNKIAEEYEKDLEKFNKLRKESE